MSSTIRRRATLPNRKNAGHGGGVSETVTCVFSRKYANVLIPLRDSSETTEEKKTAFVCTAVGYFRALNC